MGRPPTQTTKVSDAPGKLAEIMAFFCEQKPVSERPFSTKQELWALLEERSKKTLATPDSATTFRNHFTRESTRHQDYRFSESTEHIVALTFGFSPNDPVWREGSKEEFRAMLERIHSSKDTTLKAKFHDAEAPFSRLISCELTRGQLSNLPFDGMKETDFDFDLTMLITKQFRNISGTEIGLKRIALHLEMSSGMTIYRLPSFDDGWDKSNFTKEVEFIKGGVAPNTFFEISSTTNEPLKGSLYGKFGSFSNISAENSMELSVVVNLVDVASLPDEAAEDPPEFEPDDDLVDAQNGQLTGQKRKNVVDAILRRLRAEEWLGDTHSEDGEYVLARHMVSFEGVEGESDE